MDYAPLSRKRQNLDELREAQEKRPDTYFRTERVFFRSATK